MDARDAEICGVDEVGSRAGHLRDSDDVEVAAMRSRANRDLFLRSKARAGICRFPDTGVERAADRSTEDTIVRIDPIIGLSTAAVSGINRTEVCGEGCWPGRRRRIIRAWAARLFRVPG